MGCYVAAGLRGIEVETSRTGKDGGGLVLWHSSGDGDKMSYSGDILEAYLILWKMMVAWSREGAVGRCDKLMNSVLF